MEPVNKTEKKNPLFPFMAVGSLMYAFFYTFCLYRNTSGITYPFFVGGTCLFFFCYLKKSKVTAKKFSIFIVISLVLLGISTCCTDSWPLLFFNNVAVLFLFFYLMLHNTYEDKHWDLSKYFSAMMNTGIFSLAHIYRPFADMIGFCRTRYQNTSMPSPGKRAMLGKIKYVLFGLLIAMPFLLIVLLLLSSADAVFSNLIECIFTFDLFPHMFDFIFDHVFGIVFLFMFAFFAAYCLMCHLTEHGITEEVPDKRRFEPLIGITATGMISFVYLIFCLIQIVFLFGGFGRLPKGYTYASYAREGFFQLVFVCLLNLSLVLFCVKYFRKNMILQGILVFISLCTFIMIASSAYRMLLYIDVYHLTFLRVFVLWALAVIFLLMCGAILLIFWQDFPLVKYCVIVVTTLYIGFSFSHPDYWIAKYNLDLFFVEETDSAGNMEYTLSNKGDYHYIRTLSLDAAPAVFAKLSEVRSVSGEEDWFVQNIDWWADHFEIKKPESLRELNFSELAAYLKYKKYLE